MFWLNGSEPGCCVSGDGFETCIFYRSLERWALLYKVNYTCSREGSPLQRNKIFFLSFISIFSREIVYFLLRLASSIQPIIISKLQRDCSTRFINVFYIVYNCRHHFGSMHRPWRVQMSSLFWLNVVIAQVEQGRPIPTMTSVNVSLFWLNVLFAQVEQGRPTVRMSH